MKNYTKYGAAGLIAGASIFGFLFMEKKDTIDARICDIVKIKPLNLHPIPDNYKLYFLDLEINHRIRTTATLHWKTAEDIVILDSLRIGDNVYIRNLPPGCLEKADEIYNCNIMVKDVITRKMH